jgi:formylglycine-generating enzyme required for sulfatase activity/uncharacterized caspase-like protein
MLVCLRSFIVLMIGLCLMAAPALAENKLAFVVGINAYPKLEPNAQLQRAVADATAVTAVLRGLGFTVTRAADADATTRENFWTAFDGFTKTIQPGDTVLLYYAGHGVSLPEGTYLIPSDIAPLKPGDEARLKREAVSEHELAEDIHGAGARIVVLVFDACRNNPFAQAGHRAIGLSSRGLTRLEASDGMFTLYSAGEGQTALDRLSQGDTDQNSVFTRVFLKALRTPGLNISALGDQVRDEVAALAQADGQEQTPAFYNQLLGARHVFLAGPATSPAAPAGPSIPTAADAEGEAFAAAMLQDDVFALDAFLGHYPNGRFSARVRAERARLTRPVEVAALQPPAPQLPAAPARACNGVTQASLRERAVGPLTPDEICALQPKDAFKECTDCPTMVVVPKGSFTMGSPASEPGRYDVEGPRHEVHFAEPFAVGKFAVTFDEWDACVSDGGCGGYRPGDEGWGRGLRPVINVSWDDAQAYVKWLAGKTRKPYRLLSEAEWEYAARAGTTTIFWWGNSISTDKANYDGTYTYNGGPKGAYRQKTLPVDSFKPNPWGLYNMLGNAWQWVQDCFEETYSGASDDGSAVTTSSCNARVLRGGSWGSNPRVLRAAVRGRIDPVDRNYRYGGFRVALALPRTQ